MTDEEHAALGRPYTLQEADDACLGRGPAAAEPPRLTVEDAVLLLLHEDPRPLEGKKSRVRRALVAAARVLRESGVEPVLFSGGRRGPRASHINDAVEQLAFSDKVRVSGGRGSQNLAIEIAPRGRAAIGEKHESLPPAARAKLARIRAKLGALRPRPPSAKAEPALDAATAARLQKYVSRGERLFEEGKYDEAYANYRLAAKLCAPDADLHLKMAMSMGEMGLHEDALRHCRAAIRADPAGAAGYAAAAHCLNKLGLPAKALPYSKRAVLRDPSNPRMHTLCGVTLNRLGRHAEAVSHHQRAAGLDPGSVQARQNASFSLFQLGRYEEALRQVEEAARMSPKDPVAHVRIATCLSRMDRHEEAASAGRRAVEAAPGRADSYFPLLDALFKQGRYGKALEWCSRASKECPDDPRPHYATALALRALGRQEEALPHCEKSVELDPYNPDFRAAMSYLLRDLKRLDEALPHCKAVVSAEPGNLNAHSNMGSMLAELGRHKEALACFGRALRIDPRQPVPRYNRALSLQETGRPRRALREYKRVIALDPGNTGAYNNMGTVLSALGREGEALAHFDRALELDPGNAEAHLNKALSLQHLDQHGDALAHFDRAIVMKPGSADARVGRLSCLDRLKLEDKEIGRYAEEVLGPSNPDKGGGPGAAGRQAGPTAAAERADRRRLRARGAISDADREKLVRSLLGRRESLTLEYKSRALLHTEGPGGSKTSAGKLARALCCFANTKGGNLLIGVGDDGKAEGLGPDGGRLSHKEKDKIMTRVADVIDGYLGAEHGDCFDYGIVEVDGLDILHCAVARSEREPVLLEKKVEGKHVFFTRVGNTCKPLDSKKMLHYVKKEWFDWSPHQRPIGRPAPNRADEAATLAGGRGGDPGDRGYESIDSDAGVFGSR